MSDSRLPFSGSNPKEIRPPRGIDPDDLADPLHRSSPASDPVTAGDALRAALARLDAIVNQALIGIAETDVAGRITMVNDTWCALVGRPRDDLLARRLVDLIHPDDRAAYLAQRGRLLLTGGSSFEERRYVKPDGGTAWVRRVVLPMFAANGEPTGFLILANDVTEHRCRMLEMERLASIAENSSDFIGMATLAGQVLYVNEAGRRMVGLEDAEVAKATSVRDYFDPRDLPYAENEFLPRVIAEGRFAGEVNFRHFQTGEPIPVLWDVFLVPDPTTGGPTNLATVSRDLRERRRHLDTIEKSLIEARAGSKAKSEFLANISHELRTPLNAILGFADLLASRMAGTSHPVEAEYLGIIRDSGLKLLRLIGDMIDLSRIELDTVDIDATAVDSRWLVEDCIAQLRPRIEARGLTVTSTIPFDAPAVAGDPLRLKQILMQLVSNAVKFTGAGGTVEVRVWSEAGGGVRLEVADTGIGMTRAEVETALQPFGQAAAAYSRSEDGVGLGLPLARRLTRLHGGTLSIDSAKGVGTTVSVVLPAADAEPAKEGRLLPC